MSLARRNRKPVPHMLITRTLANTDLEIKDRQCINAFTFGVATTEHFDRLLLIMNLLLVAGQTDKSRRHALDYAEQILKPVITSIRNRYLKTGKLGVNAEELKILWGVPDFNREFWLRQPGEVFDFAQEQVNEYYRELAAKRGAATQQQGQLT